MLQRCVCLCVHVSHDAVAGKHKRTNLNPRVRSGPGQTSDQEKGIAAAGGSQSQESRRVCQVSVRTVSVIEGLRIYRGVFKGVCSLLV